jgi:hypothetical protein
MFGFGKKKEGMHIFFLQTVAASHSMRKTFCSIWNSYRHIAHLEPLPPGDKEVIKFFDMYNKLYTSNLLNEFNIASRSNPQIQTLPFLMYFSSMQDAINEEPGEHETDEIKNFSNFSLAEYKTYSKSLVEDWGSYSQQFLPYKEYAEELYGLIRFFTLEMRKIQNNPSIDEFLTIVTKEFKNVHKETWLTTIDRTGLKSGNYDTNNQTNEYWDILMDRFRDT